MENQSSRSKFPSKFRPIYPESCNRNVQIDVVVVEDLILDMRRVNIPSGPSRGHQDCSIISPTVNHTATALIRFHKLN